MIGYEITYDKDAVKEAIDYFQFVGGNTDRAMTSAINTTLTRSRKLAVAEMETQVNLDAKYIRSKLNLIRSSRRNLIGKVVAESRGLLMSKYATDPQINTDETWQRAPLNPARGIEVKVKPTGPVKRMSTDYFYMILPTSHALAIVRRRTSQEISRRSETNSKSRGGKIDVAYAPSVSQVFNEVRGIILEDSATIFQDRLLVAMNNILKKKYPEE